MVCPMFQAPQHLWNTFTSSWKETQHNLISVLFVLQVTRKEGWCFPGVQTPTLVCFVLDQWQILFFESGQILLQGRGGRGELLEMNLDAQGNVPLCRWVAGPCSYFNQGQNSSLTSRGSKNCLGAEWEAMGLWQLERISVGVQQWDFIKEKKTQLL